METTVIWDVVEPLYETVHDYRFGRGTWSWILWQDGSINYEDQVRYIDLAAAMGYEYVLIDNWWDRTIGREKMKSLADYAHRKGVDIFLWYSSSGYWNDIVQSPVNCMDNPIVRKREMRWLESLGVKGIKVDFFGGDKQETMRLYEAILSDADDCGLMVIFHGCTLPRGWERMYPNYVGSEAVLASENRTTDAFQLATTVLFQNPIQNFALAPNNLTDASQICLDFLKQVPVTWDETVFIDGYPGKYCILARRHGDKWYVAGVNAQKEPLKLKIQLPMFAKGNRVTLYNDDLKRNVYTREVTLSKNKELSLTILSGGGIVFVK